MKPKACEQGAVIADHDTNFTLRAQKYREGARLLRSATEMMSPAQANDLLEIAKELDELADIIERLRFKQQLTGHCTRKPRPVPRAGQV